MNIRFQMLQIPAVKAEGRLILPPSLSSIDVYFSGFPYSPGCCCCCCCSSFSSSSSSSSSSASIASLINGFAGYAAALSSAYLEFG